MSFIPRMIFVLLSSKISYDLNVLLKIPRIAGKENSFSNNSNVVVALY